MKTRAIMVCLVVLAVSLSATCSAEQAGEGNAVVKRDSVLPEPFDLISPVDNATVTTSMPILDWEDSSDEHSGLDHYEVWIDNNNVDNVTTSEYTTTELKDGTHEWYVMAVDYAGNGRASDSVFSFRVAAPPGPPLTEILIVVAVGALVFAAAYLLWRKIGRK